MIQDDMCADIVTIFDSIIIFPVKTNIQQQQPKHAIYDLYKY